MPEIKKYIKYWDRIYAMLDKYKMSGNDRVIIKALLVDIVWLRKECARLYCLERKDK